MLEYISSIKAISFLAVKKNIKHGIIQDNIFCQLKLWISFDLYEQNKHEIIKILKGVVCVSFCKLSEDLLLWYTCTSMFIFEGDHCYWRLSSRSVPPGLKKIQMDDLEATIPYMLKGSIYSAQKLALVFDWLSLFNHTFCKNNQ